MRVTEIYDKRTVRRSFQATCRICGKRRQRTLSDWYTMNPYNRSTEKECRDRIIARIDAEAEKAMVDGIICRRCEAIAL